MGLSNHVAGVISNNPCIVDERPAGLLRLLQTTRFADIPFPTSEDWEAATGKVFPKTFSHQVSCYAVLC